MKTIITIASLCIILCLTLASKRFYREEIFYYSYQDKINLNPAKNKIHLRLNANKSEIEPLLSGIVKSTKWTTDNSALVEFNSETKLDEFLESSLAKGIITRRNKVYKVADSDFELAVGEQIVVKFKTGVSKKEIDGIIEKYRLIVRC